MPPVVAAVSAAVAWIGTAAAAVAAWAGTFGTFLISQVISFGLSKLLAPKAKSNDRPADALQLSLGENPREALFGTQPTGGQLVDAANRTRYSGYTNGAEILVVKLADHEIDSLVGFYVNDEYVAWAGDGTYSAYNNSFVEGLRVYLQKGTQTQTVPSYITTNWASFWPSAKTMLGCAHVFVEYADTKDRDIWPAGRPRFVWVVKGAKLYDPRKDSTVAGGSGAHRWGTPSTYEWSDNAYLCRYNWVRGIYNGTQLMVGRGLTATEAPPERAIARANVCDEDVDLLAGGSEKRYRANGLVKSNDTAIDVEEWFAAAMGGDLVDRDGVVDIDPGEAKSTVWTVTDGDLCLGEGVTYNRFLNENQRVNTVVARFVDPAQRYEDVSAPMRRDAADVTADGRPYEIPLDLPFVQSGTQAQRVAEIRRRQARLERSFQITLPPRYVGMESGDWVSLTSDRYLGGDTIEAVVTAVNIRADFKVDVGLREIAASVYDWDEATDEIAPGSVVATGTAAPPDIEVVSFAAAAAVLTTAAGSVPAIQCTWAAFDDASVTGVQIQVRKTGETTITPTTVSDATVLEAFVTAGVGAQQAMQARAKAISLTPGRKCNWTDWEDVTTSGATFDNALSGLGVNGVVNSEFENGTLGWAAAGDGNTTFTPVRGRNAVAGKYGALNVLSATIAGTPANGTVFDVWCQAGWTGAAPTLAHLRRYGLACKAGDRIFGSALYAFESLAALQVVVLWWDKDGSYLDASYISPGGGTAGGGGDGAPANFTRIGGFVTAPANTAYATHSTRAYCDGSANPKAYMALPMLARVPAGQTAWPEYAPGPSDKAATKGAVIGTNLLRPDATLPGLVELETPKPNRLKNSSGRLGSAHWTTPVPSTVGPFGSEYIPNGGFSTGAVSAYTNFQFQSVPVVAGQSYSASGKVWLGVRTAGAASIYMAWVDSGGTEIGYPAGTGSLTTNGNPHVWSAPNLVAPAGAVSLRMVLYCDALSASSCVFSELKIEDGIYATAWTEDADVVAASTDQIIDQSSVIGRAGLVTSLGTAAAITGQKSGATTQITAGTSAPGSPASGDWWLDTNTTVPIWKRWSGSAWVATNPEAPYLTAGGQIVDYRGLPINSLGPYGITRSDQNVIGSTIQTTQITIISHTVYAPGGNISVTGGTITGLTAATVYDCFWRMSNSTLSAEVAGSTAANEKRANPDYLWLATGEPGAAPNEEAGIDRLSYGKYL